MSLPETFYWFCEKEGNPPHAWEYRGKRAQAYLCRNCGLLVSKAALKEHTDA